MLASAQLDAIAAEVKAAQDASRSMEPPTSRHPGFDIDSAYEVAARVRGMRVAAGAVPCGRKIGFTNARIWPEYGVHQPIWGYVYEHTLHRAGPSPHRLSLSGLVEPKIEPEIAFCLREAPAPDTDLAGLLQCVDWVALAFEVVQSHFPGWKFQAADTVADGGLHGALVLGPPLPIDELGPDPAAVLATFSLSLLRDGQQVETGHGSNVLGSPLAAMAHLVALLGQQPSDAALQPGEVVTTGTLTAAYPVRAGQHWRAEPAGIALAPLALAFTD